jgi:group I intron endonuclease
MKTGIYKITNIVNDKIYIGSALNISKRWSIHKRQLLLNKHHSIKLQRSYDKHGINNFKIDIIEECDIEILIEREQYFIDLYNSYNTGYNCSPTAGSTLGRKASAEQIKRMSISRKGLTPWNKGIIGISKETSEKLSRAGMGRKHSEESKIKISNSKIGHTVSVEARKKISTANTGKIISEDTRKKMSESHTGKKHILTDKARQELSDRNSFRLMNSKEVFICDHCKFTTNSKMNFVRWHGDNCKKQNN